MKDWVGLGGWLRNETVYLPEVQFTVPYSLIPIDGIDSIRKKNTSGYSTMFMMLSTYPRPIQLRSLTLRIRPLFSGFWR